MLSEDTIERYIDKDGKLVTKRLICKKGSVPRWASRLIKSKLGYVIEESVVDPINRTFLTRKRNIEWQSVVSIKEEVVYRPSNENLNNTVVERRAIIDSRVFVGALQSYGIKLFKENWIKSSKGYQSILAAMYPGSTN